MQNGIINSLKQKILDAIETRRRSEDMGLSELEVKLFDSVEFCLALLGTIPMPICVADETGRIILLNTAKFVTADKQMSCAHCEKAENSEWEIKSDNCTLCKAIDDAFKTDQKVQRKGLWHAAVGGREKEFIILVNAVPAKIDNKKYVLASIEDLTEIEQLKGLLPICMECSKIHDKNTNKWVRIDEYITSNSHAKFSHGLCPECSKEIIGNIEKD